MKEIKLRLLLVLLGLLHHLLVSAATSLFMQRLSSSNTNLSQFATTNESACFSLCSPNISAVSYSWKLGQCMTNSICDIIRVAYDVWWKTILCQSNASCSCYSPLFEFSFSNQCGDGNVNSGSLSPGLKMNFQSAWTASTPSASTLLGDTTAYSRNAYAVTDYSNFQLDFNRSFTFFTYFWVNKTAADQNSFCLLEFGHSTSGDFSTYTFSFHYWIWNGGLYFTADINGCTGACLNGVYYTYSPPIKTWVHTALVYDPTKGKFFTYLNGNLVSITGPTYYVAPFTANHFVTIGRPTDSPSTLPGAVYCWKIFQAALTESQLQKIAASCQYGRISYEDS